MLAASCWVVAELSPTYSIRVLVASFIVLVDCSRESVQPWRVDTIPRRISYRESIAEAIWPVSLFPPTYFPSSSGALSSRFFMRIMDFFTTSRGLTHSFTEIQARTTINT